MGMKENPHWSATHMRLDEFLERNLDSKTFEALNLKTPFSICSYVWLIIKEI